jgi:hypothetical protein
MGPRGGQEPAGSVAESGLAAVGEDPEVYVLAAPHSSVAAAHILVGPDLGVADNTAAGWAVVVAAAAADTACA